MGEEVGDWHGVKVYSQVEQGLAWLQRYRGCPALLACVFGFTETALIPGISAAGATPAARQVTALADAELLARGLQGQPTYGLPPLTAGVSPVLLTRSLLEVCGWPLWLFDAGLNRSPSVPMVALPGAAARCLSTGQALPLAVVERLLQAGLAWGDRLAAENPQGYLILGECVVGGTTTALAVLLGLGIEALGRVGSSHPTCNHDQKAALVRQGLAAARWELGERSPLALVAAIGDPMQVVVAGMALSASRHVGVLLAGGTQMLAVAALAAAIAEAEAIPWQPEAIAVGTTRWLAEDPTCDAPGLAAGLPLPLPLLATQLSFAGSQHGALRRYEAGFVKEGVAAGASAIAASLQGLDLAAIASVVDKFVGQYFAWQNERPT